MFIRGDSSRLLMKGLSPTQIEQLRTIVEQLKQERQRQGILLEEIALKTYVPLRQLHALETDDNNVLPEPVFVQGFIRRYADALGMDGMALSKSFDFQPETAHQAIVSTEIKTPLPPPTEQYLQKPPSKSEKRLRSRSRTASSGPNPLLWLLAAGAALLVGVGLYELTRASNTAQKPGNSSGSLPDSGRPAPDTGTLQAVPSPAISPGSTLAEPTPSSLASAPVEVTINTTGRSWLEVFVDGSTQPAISETVQKGYTKTWTAQKSLRVIAGDAGNVQVVYNQQPVKPLGRAGEVEEVVYTPVSSSSVSSP